MEGKGKRAICQMGEEGVKALFLAKKARLDQMVKICQEGGN